MKLLQSEVNLVPGEDPNYAHAPEGFVGQGVAILELSNTTGYQNAYKIRLECSEPFWKPIWAQIVPLEPDRGDNNGIPSGYPDQLGPKNQWATVYVADGGTRKIMVALRAPRTSEARAGIYRFNVIIESRIDDPMSPMSEIKELPLTAVIRPFYEVEAAWSPESGRVGLVRRKRRFELVLTSTGNDWTYIEAALGNKAEISLERDAEVIALPPPAPGEKISRALGFRATTKLKKFRSANIPTELPVTLRRVDAPGVPPLVGLPQQTQNANLGAAVLSSVEDPLELETRAKLIYCPPIPATFEQFLQAIVRNGKSIVFFAIGLVIVGTLTFAGYQRFMMMKLALSIDATLEDGYRIITQDPKTGEMILRLNGSGLRNARVTLLDETGKEMQIDPLPLASPATDKSGKKKPNPELVAGRQTWFDPSDDKYAARYDLTPVIKQTGKANPIFGGIVVRPNFIFGDLMGFLARTKTEKLSIGKPTLKVATLAIQPSKTEVLDGDTILIGGTNFGTGGTVRCDSLPAKVISWSDNEIKVKLPEGLPDQFLLIVETAGGTAKGSAPLKLKAEDIMELPDNLMGGGDAGGGGAEPEIIEPEVAAAPPPPRPTSRPTAPSGAGTSVDNGSLIPVTMVEADVYEGLIQALGSGRSEILRFADTPARTLEGRACRAYALATSGNVDAAERLLNGMKDQATNDREQMFFYIGLAEVAHKRGDNATADRLFLAADSLAQDMKEGTEGTAMANLAYARYYVARGKSAGASSKARSAMKRATSQAEKDLASSLM